MQERTTIHSEITVQSEISSVWSYLSNPSVLATMCRGELGIDIVFPDKNNTFGAEVARRVFAARASSYNILLTGAGCSYAIRLSEHRKSCRILIAAAFDNTSFVLPSQIHLDNFLQRIELETRPSQPKSTDAFFSPLSAKTEPEANTASNNEQKVVYHAEAENNEASPPSSDALLADVSVLDSDNQNIDSEANSPQIFKKEQIQQSRKPRWPLLFVALAAMVAVVCAAYMFIPSFRLIFGEQVPESSGYSAKVNYKTAMKISVGNSKDSVEKAFGTDGVPAPGKYENRMVYRGGSVSDSGRYSIQVCVDYSGNTVSLVTYLDLGIAAGLDSPLDKNADINANMTIEEIAGAVGVPASMIRTYKSNNDDIVEMHFGFTDPFANFDPAWRGEFAVTINKTAETITKQVWPGYDGSDPLMIDSLDGHPAANQYDDYTEFLNDKYRYDQALYMLNKYSRGDAIKVFGEITLYDDTSGVKLYYCNSEDTLPDGQPAYTYSFGFDSKGQFLMSSFSNIRLFSRQGMLIESSYGDIMRGMAYNEVRYLMQVLPTAIWIDQNYFTLCYGQKLDSDIFENSFDFIVRIDIENNYVQTIWNNMPSNI